MLPPTATLVTTSWDDAHPCDLRLIECLSAYGIAGTFYVPIERNGYETIPLADIRKVYAGFEVGAHSWSHPDMRGVDDRQLEKETRGVKLRLEDSIGAAVRMFCYPMGYQNARVRRAVQRAGYVGARTTRPLHLETGGNRWRIPATLNACPLPRWILARRVVRRCDLRGLLLLSRTLSARTWNELAERLFDRAVRHGGVWHMWGHSWEIEQLGLWNDFRRLLAIIARRPGVRYCTNSEVIEEMYPDPPAAPEDHRVTSK